MYGMHDAGIFTPYINEQQGFENKPNLNAICTIYVCLWVRVYVCMCVSEKMSVVYVFKILLVYYVWNASEIIERTWHAENVLIHHVNFVGYFLTVEIVNIAIWCPIDIYPYITYHLVERHALHSV